MCYTATVFAEALPEVDIGRGTAMSFRVLAAPWLDCRRVFRQLRLLHLPGLEFYPFRHRAARPPNAGIVMDSIRLQVTDPGRFRPVLTSLHIVAAMHDIHGTRRLWHSEGARPHFFDKLYGTDRVRKALGWMMTGSGTLRAFNTASSPP